MNTSFWKQVFSDSASMPSSTRINLAFLLWPFGLGFGIAYAAVCFHDWQIHDIPWGVTAFTTGILGVFGIKTLIENKTGPDGPKQGGQA